MTDLEDEEEVNESQLLPFSLSAAALELPTFVTPSSSSSQRSLEKSHWLPEAINPDAPEEDEEKDVNAGSALKSAEAALVVAPATGKAPGKAATEPAAGERKDKS